MGGFVNVNGSKKEISQIFTNVNGSKKEIVSGWANKDGVVTQIYGSALKGFMPENCIILSLRQHYYVSTDMGNTFNLVKTFSMSTQYVASLSGGTYANYKSSYVYVFDDNSSILYKTSDFKNYEVVSSELLPDLRNTYPTGLYCVNSKDEVYFTRSNFVYYSQNVSDGFKAKTTDVVLNTRLYPLTTNCYGSGDFRLFYDGSYYKGYNFYKFDRNYNLITLFTLKNQNPINAWCCTEKWVFILHNNNKLYRFPIGSENFSFTEEFEIENVWGTSQPAILRTSFVSENNDVFFCDCYITTNKLNLFAIKLDSDGNFLEKFVLQTTSPFTTTYKLSSGDELSFMGGILFVFWENKTTTSSDKSYVYRWDGTSTPPKQVLTLNPVYMTSGPSGTTPSYINEPSFGLLRVNEDILSRL